ncbi:MAG: hypothetical protein HOW73_17995 [Polyangiaceae bacterium]|nr:hypothetical protein [Polyangiaceae bacterium]
MNRFASLYGLPFVFAVVACGANVVFGDDDGGGNGGNADDGNDGAGNGVVSGGAPSTNTNTSVTATGVTNSSVATTSVGGAPPNFVCEIGQSNGNCDECAQHAIETTCSDIFQACENGQDDCFAYAKCAANCFGDQACCSECAAHTPEGAQAYTDLIVCVACNACFPECNSVAPGFCGIK